MSTIQKIIEEFRNEANIDFISIYLIAAAVEEDLGLKNQPEIRSNALKVMKGLMEQDICPGDYDNAAHISFWTGTPDEMLKRIETEWIAMGKTPDLAKPICWFGLRPPAAA